jgi:hypothetical protein
LSIASNIINIVVLIIQRYSFITTLFSGPFDDVITKFYCTLMMDWKQFGRKRSWRNPGTLLEFSWTYWRKPQKIPIGIAGVPAEIRTEYLQNTYLEHCVYSSLFGGNVRVLSPGECWLLNPGKFAQFCLVLFPKTIWLTDHSREDNMRFISLYKFYLRRQARCAQKHM